MSQETTPLPEARLVDDRIACPSCGNSDIEMLRLLEDVVSVRRVERSEAGYFVAQSYYEVEDEGGENLRILCVNPIPIPEADWTETHRKYPEFAYNECLCEFTIPSEIQLDYE